jgi:trehalose synthase-fused probable maltokinase
MAEHAQTIPDITELLDAEGFRAWLEQQRWYASKSRRVTGVSLAESIPLCDQPVLELALLEAGFATGAHELYQVPVVLRPADENGISESSERVSTTGSWAVYDALAEPDQAGRLLTLIDDSRELETEDGMLRFRRTAAALDGAAGLPARLVGAEQSNSSVVFGDRVVLKVFRRLEPGINPELEMLRFLTARSFASIAPLYGWYEYEGQAFATTLGVGQEFIAGATDGWQLALDRLASAADWLVERLGELGSVTGRMHTVLASDADDPAFSPEEPSEEAMSLLTATIDEDIEHIFVRLPSTPELEQIAGRGEDVRELLQARSQLGVGGRMIRTHGDYHLGQTLYADRGWIVIDFEGEPARPLSERRQKRSPLRDVASMLRSFAYVSSASQILRGVPAPPEFEARAREAFLGGYLEAVDASLLPHGETAIENTLFVYELEKAIYELRYELDNRPDWVSIPAAGIRRLLEGA